MYRLQVKYILLSFFVLGVNGVFAQKNERDYIRSGNKLYKDSAFVKAEVDYRKALDINPSSTESMYNLGNSLTQQQKYKEALEQYIAASKIEKNKMKLSHIYHNMGVLFQAAQQYPQALEAYKQALRNNPKDDETRYNLALVQKLLKDQQQNSQNQNNEDQQKEQEENKQDQQKEQQNQDNQKEDQEKEDKQQSQPQEKEDENQISKENAEQLLNAVMQDEKDVQEKVKKMQQVQGKKLDKDW